ncbi:MAG: hypothetical protein KY428_06305 [Bacteroidetes bacterium]|nr:hypothetical protein [Bacteroidota bacterium]
MAVLETLLKIFGLLSLLMLLAGLWKPVTVLWWLDYQNRRRVLQYYGTATLVLAALWAVVGWLHP